MNELLKARKAAGLTQVQLSKRAGVDQQTISYHETKAKRRPYQVNALKLSLALGVDVDNLFPSPGGPSAAAGKGVSHHAA